MIQNCWDQSLSPGNEQTFYWGSAAADQPGTRNYMGIKNAAVDAMITALLDGAKPRSDFGGCSAGARSRSDFRDFIRSPYSICPSSGLLGGRELAALTQARSMVTFLKLGGARPSTNEPIATLAAGASVYLCGGSTGESSARMPMSPTFRQRSMIFSNGCPPDLNSTIQDETDLNRVEPAAGARKTLHSGYARR